MSGLFAGLQLRARGFAVDIYERVDSELSGRGAGIVAQPGVPRAMRALGIDTADLGVEMTTRKILDAEGRTVCEAECPQTLTAWERLYRILRDAFPAEHYHRGVGLKGFEQNGGSVLAHLSDGRSVQADLLIGADGIRSSVRQQLLPDLNPLYAGYVAWRALIAGTGHPAGDPSPDIRVHDLLPAARRAVSELSGRRPGQRPAPRPPPSQRDLVSAGRGEDRTAAPADRRKRRRRIRCRSRRRLFARSTSPRCAPPPSGSWRRSSAPSRA